MLIDPAAQRSQDNYKLLTNLVVPRPIAWVTTLSEAGVVNLAPFSFFNAVGSDPLMVFISVARHDDGSLKDTARHIEHSRAFVVNMVTEDVLRAMNLSAADFPEQESELLAAGLRPRPSVRIAVPGLAEARASMECQLRQQLDFGSYTLYFGEVLMFHVADELVDARLHIKSFDPIGRMGSPSFYCRTTDRFELPRTTYAAWRQAQEES